MKGIIIGYILCIQQLLCFQKNMFAYFNTSDCPQGWVKQEGGFFLVGQAQNKQNIQKNQDGSFNYIQKNYTFGKTIGSMSTTLSVDQMPSHVHNYLKTSQGIFKWKNGRADKFLINELTWQQTSTAGGNLPFDIMPESYVATLCLYADTGIDINELLNAQADNSNKLQQSNNTSVSSEQQLINKQFEDKLIDLKREYLDQIEELKNNYNDKLQQFNETFNSNLVTIYQSVSNIYLQMNNYTDKITSLTNEITQLKQNISNLNKEHSNQYQVGNSNDVLLPTRIDNKNKETSDQGLTGMILGIISISIFSIQFLIYIFQLTRRKFGREVQKDHIKKQKQMSKDKENHIQLNMIDDNEKQKQMSKVKENNSQLDIISEDTKLKQNYQDKQNDIQLEINSNTCFEKEKS